MKIKSRNSITIRLPKERLDHIVFGHPEMKDYMGYLAETITTPELIYEGSQKEFLAIKSIRKHYIVVVYKEEDQDGFVVTAFITRSIKYLEKRKIIWKKS